MSEVKITNARLAFPVLFRASAFKPEDKPAFSAIFILDLKENADSIQLISAAIREAARGEWQAESAKMLKQFKATDKLCLHAGDTKTQYDGFEGKVFISARSAARPLVLNANKSPLVEADGKPYAGCYVNALIEIWAQNNAYGKRINAQLRGVQFVRDGEAFGAGSPASEDEFDALDDLPPPGDEPAIDDGDNASDLI